MDCDLTVCGHHPHTLIMGLARTIVAIVVAFSLAILPVVGGAVAAGTMAVAADSAATPSGHDGCDGADTPAHKGMDGCQLGTACSFACLSFSAAFAADVVIQPPAPHAAPAFVSQGHRLHAAYPPFRPPRA